MAIRFRASLAELMLMLKSADPHVIRGVKPNEEKGPGKFSAPIVMEQLVLGGVMEAVAIRQRGYASRSRCRWSRAWRPR